MNDIATYLLTLFLELITVLIYCFHIFEAKRKTKHAILIFSIGYTILFAITFAKNPIINLLSFCIINTVCVLLSFVTSPLYSIFTGIFISIVMAVSEFFTELAVVSFFQKYKTPALDDIKITACLIISKFLFFSILYFMASKKQKKSLFEISFIQILMLVLSFSMIVVILYMAITLNITSGISGLLYYCCFGIIIINLCMFYLQDYIQRKQELLNETKLNLYYERQSKKYYDLVKEQDERQKILIHDIKNHLLAIKRLSESENNSESVSYINDLFESPSLNSNYKISKSHNLNLIMSRYISKCHSLGIDLDIDAASCEIDFLSPAEMTSIFCNIMDNAISAAGDCNNGFISIIIKEKIQANSITISIVNSCLTEPAYDEKGELKTRKNKEELHGLGMKSVKQIVLSHNGEMHSFYNKDDLTFHLILYMTK